ncbi:ATP-binding protein [Commensalibacter papalotli (ex Botero et al. 2024)]|uniref:histidine kinase n=1 Tax=Commensalibacter papalotli (ex Botero et al. 2024) TaxID=2972766 RepID=A0ABN8WBC6_9PROT|nr:ATP-binding protein [Commensalibacter papalotli (ex Botero et al. 2024)]CAI3944400.1 Signal transduction histidine kinase (BaeS) (PDB:1JOY) [Commensalibacter papalotli (ex Botero et al. 2024)]CAI3946505.1 Signal transduction histidine kinase (BaeS) (PDB:1JOY) [Commensalibacter papalotli (ex Botero et al. 2024)]
MTKTILISEPLTVKQLINSFDWNNTSLGDPDSWSPNLQALLSLILNTSLPMVIYWGKQNIALYNDAYAKLIGVKHPALLGRPLIQMWPERKAHFNQIVSAIYQKETIRYTTDYQIPGTQNPNSIQTQIEVAFSPILDKNNQVQGMLSIITQTHEANLSPAQTIEQLIGGLAHDFNTLLAGIIGNLELMQMRIKQNKLDMLPRYIEAAQKATTQATDITHQLLSFSRRQTLVPHVIDPNHTIQALLDSFNNLIKEDNIKQTINIQIQLEPEIWSIFCDPEHLKNAILHIFKNSCEAIHASNGTILIKTQNITITSAHHLRKFIKPNDYIVITIQDNGTGMSPDMISRATDPFFTTKPLGKRAGLGLSMAYGFTKQSSGHLTIDSDPKTGTIVSLFLPRYYRPLIIQKLYNNPAKTNTLKTLLISQDNHLCMLLSENLENLGYSMTIAQTEKETFTLLKSCNNFCFIAVDTRLLSDAQTNFLSAINENYPDLPILFITGYEETPIMLKSFIKEQSFVIRKPITHTMIADSIKAIEDSKQANAKREE